MNILKIVKDGHELTMNIDHLLLKNLQLLSVPTDEVISSLPEMSNLSLILQQCINDEHTVYLNGDKIIWEKFISESKELYLDKIPDGTFESSVQHFLITTLFYRFLPSKYSPHLKVDTTVGPLERSLRCVLVYSVLARLFSLLSDEQYDALKQEILAYPENDVFPIVKRQKILDKSKEEIACSLILNDIDYQNVLRGKYCSTIEVKSGVNS